jgi:hypothetical protein
MQRMQRLSLIAATLATIVIVSLTAVLGTAPFRSPTQAQGVSLTLQAGGNNIVYQGDALPVADALNDATSAVAAVWSFDALTQQWLSWNPALPAFLQGIASLEPGRAYWVEATRTAAWTILTDGAIGTGTTGSVALFPGFNNVAYDGPRQPVVDALGDVAPVVTAIWAFDAATQAWLAWSPALPDFVQGFTTLEPEQAYWLVSTATTTWQNQDAGVPASASPAVTAAAQQAVTDWLAAGGTDTAANAALAAIDDLFDAGLALGDDPVAIADAMHRAVTNTVTDDATALTLFNLDQARSGTITTVRAPAGLTAAAVPGEPIQLRRNLKTYYINGVLNTYLDALKSAKLLATLFGTDVDLFYNVSFVDPQQVRFAMCARQLTVDPNATVVDGLLAGACTGLEDTANFLGTAFQDIALFLFGFIEPIFQEILDLEFASHQVNDELEQRVRLDLLQDNAVIVVGHSQGTLFARDLEFRIEDWWAVETKAGNVNGEPPLGILHISPAFVTTDTLASQFVALPVDLLQALQPGGSETLTRALFNAEQERIAGGLLGNFNVHVIETYLSSGSTSRRHIADNFRDLGLFVREWVEGGWDSDLECATGGQSWAITLVQRFSEVAGRVSFHACPGGGRVGYNLTGTIAIGEGDEGLLMEGTICCIVGSDGVSKGQPVERQFFIQPGVAPDPNLVPRHDLHIFIQPDSETIPFEGIVTYTVTVQNNGPDRAVNVRATVAPRGVLGPFQPNELPCEPGPSGGVECTFPGTIAPGSSKIITMAFQGVVADTLIIDASVRADGADPLPNNNATTTVTTVLEPPK